MATAKKAKTLRDVDGPILRGNRLFVKVKEIGELGDNDRAVVSYGYGDRLKAPLDKPLILAQWFIREILPMCHYSDDSARDADLASLQGYVNAIKPKHP